MQVANSGRKQPNQVQPQRSSAIPSTIVEHLRDEHRRAENAMAGLQTLRDVFSHRANAIAASMWDYEASLLITSIGDRDLAWRTLHIRRNVLDSRSREAELFRRLVEKHRDFSMVLLGLVRCLSSMSLTANEYGPAKGVADLQSRIFQTCDADLHPALLQVLNQYLGSEDCRNPLQLTETSLRPLRTLVE